MFYGTPRRVLPNPDGGGNTAVEFKSSDMWHCVVECVDPDTSEDGSAFVLQVKHGAGGLESPAVMLWEPLKLMYFLIAGSENNAEQGKRMFKMEDNEEDTC